MGWLENRWRIGWMDECWDGWMNGKMDGWINGKWHGCMEGWFDVWKMK